MLFRSARTCRGGSSGAVLALRYRYEFTALAELRETGQWWTRECVSTYYGPVSLDDSRFRLQLRCRGWEVPGPEQEEAEEWDAAARIAETE